MEKRNKEGFFFQQNTEGDLQHPGEDHQYTGDTMHPKGREGPTEDKENGDLSDSPTEVKTMDGIQG